MQSLQPSMNSLDHTLVRLCQLVIQGQKQDSKKYGMVGACVVGPNGEKVGRLNYALGSNRVHAERAALDAYYEKFGEKPPRGSVIVTTLSPCSADNMIGRYAQSCTDLINEAGVHKVYAGYQDPTQPDTNRKFNLEITDNPKIQSLCKRFADTFL